MTEFCITHGRAHPEGEADDVRLLGDDLECRNEEWDVVPAEVVGSHCEPAQEPTGFLLAAGHLAYLDTLGAGLVPVKVLTIADTFEAAVKVTAARPGWDRGEVVTVKVPSLTLVSRDQVYRRNRRLRILGATNYLTETGEVL